MPPYWSHDLPKFWYIVNGTWFLGSYSASFAARKIYWYEMKTPDTLSTQNILMKKAYIFFGLMAMVFLTQAQADARYNPYDITSLVLLTDANAIQESELKLALDQRAQTISDQGDELAANEAYHQKREEILDAKQIGQVYRAQVKMAEVEKEQQFKFKKMLVNPFPTGYHKVLLNQLGRYEYDKQYLKYQHPFDDALRAQKKDSITLACDLWRDTQNNTIRDIVRKWNKIKINHEDFSDEYKSDFITYNFYASLTENVESNHERIKNELDIQNLITLAKALVDTETTRTMDILTPELRDELETAALAYGAKTLRKHLNSDLKKRLKDYETLEIVTNTSLYKEIARSAARERQKELEAAKALRNAEAYKKELMTLAKKAGLDETKGEALYARIQKREKDLKELKQQRKAAEQSSSNLFDNASLVTSKQIKTQFSKDLATLLSKKEFGIIFQPTFSEVIQHLTEEKMTELATRYTLNDAQSAELHSLVRNYYFNQTITEAYYAYDKNIRKQKRSVIRYKFEKEYLKLMDSYGVAVAPSNEINNRTFQW